MRREGLTIPCPTHPTGVKTAPFNRWASVLLPNREGTQGGRYCLTERRQSKNFQPLVQRVTQLCLTCFLEGGGGEGGVAQCMMPCDAVAKGTHQEGGRTK
eukprot:CAMPEP_0174367342 /NCGR_PEP_ID=MMETSP0811_2-20130205/84887_1 /TAXON_ID=73025 ORGANISM="Eutreptiella gymnastica-like, Strain CCMP1594" /NCGR_SAMPLE_ID=MMETSP0811_2 /ASSEMBLY_ACC=CAM_ASM_000667 /LENGTH=99 /DNA_ID=CAMNT_0015509817 /DNA_START=675 /DNA_END=974 /DNA_ORIENTATION=+